MRSFDAAAIILGCLAASAQIMALSIPAHDISTEFSPLVENVHHNLYKRSSGRAAAARAMKELEGGTFLSESQERQKIKLAKLKEEKEMITLAREEVKRKNAEQDRPRLERERLLRERVPTQGEVDAEVVRQAKQSAKRQKEKTKLRLEREQAVNTQAIIDNAALKEKAQSDHDLLVKKSTADFDSARAKSNDYTATKADLVKQLQAVTKQSQTSNPDAAEGLNLRRQIAAIAMEHDISMLKDEADGLKFMKEDKVFAALLVHLDNVRAELKKRESELKSQLAAISSKVPS